MKEKILAALLSAFALPGVGQLYNRHYRKGGIIIFSVLCATAVLLIRLSREIVTLLPTGGTYPPSWESIFLLAEKVYQDNRGWILGYLIFFFVLWIYSVVDAYIRIRGTPSLPESQT